MHALALFPLFPLGIVASFGGGPGPYENATFWEAQNQYPNATGTVSLLAVNMTDDPAYMLTPEAWVASINVTSVRNAPDTNASLAVTNTVISLNSYYGFVEDSLWDTCLVVMFGGLARNATVKGQEDTGDCTATLGSTCATDWENALVSARARAGVQGNSTDACGGMSTPPVPDSCKGTFVVDTITSSILHANQTDGSAYYYSQDEPHDPANTTYYESAVTQIWPIVIIQTPGQRTNLSKSASGFTSGKLSCLKAMNATAGSVAIGDVPGAGNRMRSGAWGLAAMMVAMLALL